LQPRDAVAIRLLLAATILLFPAIPVFAAKTDVVVLRNGDHVTGEVKQLSRGQLKLSTDDVGTVYVEWDKIASVTTALEYEVVTTSGDRHVGTLAPGSVTELKVVASNGTETMLAFLDVVSFAPIKEGFLERIDGTLDVGGSYTKSSGVGELMVDLDAAYRRPSYKMFPDFESTLTSQSVEGTTSQFTLQSGYMHFRGDGWIVSPFAYVARNVDLGFSLGTSAVLTLGRYVERSNRSETLVAFGGAAGREALIDGRTIHHIAAAARVATSFYRYDSPKTAFDLSLLVFPELNRLGRVRGFAHVKVKRELVKDLIVAVTVYDTFDSQPQVDGVSRNDVGTGLSIGWTF